ncbi:MAG: type IV pilus modification protein PilV [Hydrogenophaga sp.]|uniref:type IV pilus modification protein PilV n=1 Tax=Hydrogenophaga sp. TaxID=1904254 RepID=UPI00271A9BC6|nr:type IV pilus modification protein PilV [Hydrogenophaga sp.]MDO9147480.1 type IV pilus modification protein PilV [Hydrogenophaga sp.]MDO9605687.1 type IV pilus modification protein PilV [Hydrogenophaga sp.]
MTPFVLLAGARQRGTSMIEVLVTLVIIAIGLLGLAGLQLRLESSEMEAYQRSQALILLDDMVNRMDTNRLSAALYPVASPLTAPVGAGMTCPAPGAGATRVEQDVRDWCDALQGAAEAVSGSRVGAMIGGRGCVEDLGLGASGSQRYRVTVAWQGLTPTTAPAETCGQNLYNGSAGAACRDDLCRRTVSTVVHMANLR